MKWSLFGGVFGLFFGGVLDCNFFGESAAECEYPANPGRKFVGKKLSPRDRKFRWYKYDQEGLKRGENWFL